MSASSPMHRRWFLTLAGLATLGIAAGAIGWRRRRLIAWLARPEVEPRPTGALPPATSATLVAAARALLGEPITAEVYEDFFAWRAANLPGHLAVYTGFARHVDAAARRDGARDFASADVAARRRILEALSPTRRWRRLTEGLLHRDALIWRQQVVRETLRLFAHTDGLLRLGYDYFPGTAVGIEAALSPPRSAS